MNENISCVSTDVSSFLLYYTLNYNDNAHYTMHSTQCTVHNTQYTMHNTQNTPY